MKTCALCQRILPDESFPANNRMRTQLDSWCVDCYRKERKKWKTHNRSHTRAWKEEERGKNADPVQWAGLHCRHISQYVTKIVARFEAKTGNEAPPQLLAIKQLADQLATALPERSQASRSCLVVCRNCGREFKPKPRGDWWAAYCSSYCKERFRQIKPLFESAGQVADK